MERVLNKDELLGRIQQINVELVQCRANFAKLEGHLAECTHWLQEMEKSEKEVENDQVNDESAEQAVEE